MLPEQRNYFLLIYLVVLEFVCLFDWVLRLTDTVKVIWQRSSFTGVQVPVLALLQA
jgi:hypothetical protein